MAYLTRWRLQLGAQMLTSTNSSVAQIAAKVGYESEASFNRAFKREFSLPPAKFRLESKSLGRHAPAHEQQSLAVSHLHLKLSSAIEDMTLATGAFGLLLVTARIWSPILARPQ